RVVTNEEHAGLRWGGECGVDLAFAASLQNLELNALRARRFLHVSDHALGTRVREQRNHPGSGNQLGEQLKPLGHQLRRDRGDAREVAARQGEACDQAALTGSPPRMETIGIVEVAFLAASTGASPPVTAITSTLRATRSAANAGSRS